MTAQASNELLTTEQAAEFLGLSPKTLNTWRCTKTVQLPFVKYSRRCVRYRLEDLRAFIEQHVEG